MACKDSRNNTTYSLMNIDVGKAISELLYEHDTVILPGLGGFTSSPESATVDYVQGVVTPPAKKMSFNPNLVLNDGILVGHIQQRDVVTAQQANEAVTGFVDELKAALDRREIIEIPAVGRIYRDYEKQLKFMPEGTNFEARSFGLPDVKFTPVNRVKKDAPSDTSAPPKSTTGKVAAATQVANAAAQKAEKKAAASSGLLNRLLPALIILAAVLLAFSLYMILGGDKDENNVASVDKERVNVKPLEDDGTDSKTDDATATLEQGAGLNEDGTSTEKEDEKASAPPAKSDKEEKVSKEKPAPPVASAEAEEESGEFLVIHSFGVINNAKKFERKLEKDGYLVRSVKHQGLQRVGVSVRGKSEGEIEKLRKELSRKYKATPKLVNY